MNFRKFNKSRLSFRKLRMHIKCSKIVKVKARGMSRKLYSTTRMSTQET